MRHKCRVMRPPFSFPRKKTGVARPKERRFPLQASSSKRCVIPDKQGRITLSADHCAKAHLEKEALIVGVGNRIEIWNPEIWDQKCAENMAEIEKIAADVQL